MSYDNPYTIYTEDDDGHRIMIVSDLDPMNPRDEYNAATMVCFHRRYELGDSHDYDEPLHAVADICGVDPDAIGRNNQTIQKALNDAPIVWLPLYLYDHSGITMNTTGFSCPWDSGQVGIIYITYEQAIKEYGGIAYPITDEDIDAIKTHLRGEVTVYDKYISGRFCGYKIFELDDDEAGEEVDSCYGFEDADIALQAAKEFLGDG